MAVSKHDRDVLRELARRVADVAASPANAERKARAVLTNGLTQTRPLVWVDEIPWHEMNLDNALTPRCESSEAQAIETGLRRTLMQWERFQGDMIVEPFYNIPKAFTDSGIGVAIREDIIATDARNNIVSHHYFDQLDTPEKVDALLIPTVLADKETDALRMAQADGLFGDILPARLTGHYVYYTPWDQIGMLRGIENCLIDMAERPEFVHQTVAKFTEIGKARIDQFEAQGLLGFDNPALHCTPPYTDQLPASDYTGGPPRARDVWFRGMAQLFSAVSPQMHNEFDIEYMRPLAERFGLSYYGCCEPLDKVIPYLKNIRNLRKIGCSPWADVRSAAEQIGKDYVLSRKPNPAAVAGILDEDGVRAEISQTVEQCLKFGCPFDITLKDISTVGGKPENLFRWVSVVEETLDKYF